MLSPRAWHGHCTANQARAARCHHIRLKGCGAPCHSSTYNVIVTPGGTRTRNLWIRGPTPCPLGHEGMEKNPCWSFAASSIRSTTPPCFALPLPCIQVSGAARLRSCEKWWRRYISWPRLRPELRLCGDKNKTVWPSGLRRWLKAPVRKGVGSNPTAVTHAAL